MLQITDQPAITITLCAALVTAYITTSKSARIPHDSSS